MRPLLVSLTVALIACGKQSVDARPPIEVVVGDPNALSPPVRPQTAIEWATETVSASQPRPAETEPQGLPRSWTEPVVPGLPFGDAIRKARNARDRYSRLLTPGPSTNGATSKSWFVLAQSSVDEASRMYAAAFHASDASREGRVDAIAEAAELAMTLARSLDEAGLGSLPNAWRSDPALAISYEDIAVGPTRRWRDEARMLARQCIDAARDSGVLTDAARGCAALRTGAAPKVARRAADAGMPCACTPGDPLCSASLGGWCDAAGR